MKRSADMPSKYLSRTFSLSRYHRYASSMTSATIMTITAADRADLRMPVCDNGIEIEDISIPQLQEYFSQGTISGRQLVQCYLQRIEQLNPLLRLAHMIYTIFSHVFILTENSGQSSRSILMLSILRTGWIGRDG